MSALACALSLARSLPLALPYMTENDLEFSGGSDQQHNAWFHQLLRVLMPLTVCFCHAYRETAWFLTNISTRANANPALHHLFAATIPLACHAPSPAPLAGAMAETQRASQACVVEKGPYVCVQVILSGFPASATARCQLFPRTNLVRLGGAVDASKCEGRSRVRSTRPALRRPRRKQFVPHSVRQLHAGASHTQPRQVAARTKCKNNGHCRGTVSLAPMQACAYRRYDQRRHCTGRNRIQERS